ncbi:DUF6994 family protein [Arthrobacter sp. ISL-28]|uniref:DUF6994 family protein n=1 Tax=Arthrobacter sp. ISL-28 TaxID=2819108 RepID=UPI001BE91B33|nr:hypothetical protein [Arthrobacter sp. ISL-28]
MSNPEYPQQEQPRVFDTSFGYKTDKPSRTNPEGDKDGQMLRLDHELLWSKKLPSGDVFAPRISSAGPNEYRTSRRSDVALRWEWQFSLYHGVASKVLVHRFPAGAILAGELGFRCAGRGATGQLGGQCRVQNSLSPL